MANFNKSFNFRGGFQVDETTFIVRGEKVGIGSSVPESLLDVNGTITAKGLDISSEAAVGIESATVGFLDATLIHAGVASISAGIITATSPSGIVTYYGDARFLLGLPTSQWIDTDVGLGYTSIYAAGNVGVDTTDPRYAFQVGGVPFPTTTGPALPAQDGVGIQDGNIYASGIVSTRGEFIGLGSNITAIDGSNISVGAIGSMAYGPLIVTEEVIADKFTGIASTAISVTPDATLEFDTARANEFTAVNRFISTEGKLQIGDIESNSNVGEIQVRKDGIARIYAISNDSSSRIFVGNERPGGSANGYGGLRFGGNSGDISGSTDLDLVNYDTGNINLYVNSGVGATDQSKFQFINGRNDRILAHIDQQGSMVLGGSEDSEPTLTVVGVTSLSDVSVASSITADAVYVNDITVSSSVNVDGSFSANNPIFTGVATATEAFVAGSDPTLSLAAGVKITSGGDILANFGGIFMGSAGSEYFTVSSIGDVDARSLTLVNALNTPSATIESLSIVNDANGPDNFALSASGLSVDTFGTIDGSITTLDSTTINASTVNGSVVNAGTNSLSSSGLVVNNLTVNGAIDGTFTTLPGGITFQGDISATNVSVANSITASAAAFDTLSTNLGAFIGVSSPIVSTSTIQAQNCNFQDIICNSISPAYVLFNGFRFIFGVDTGNTNLSITITDSVGTPVGEAVIPYTPD